MPDPDDPRYVVVARTLKGEILNGTFPIGAQLPTEIALAERFAVSRHTVRAALRILREERLVVSRQGAGTQVCQPASSEAFRLEANSINDLVAYAANMYTEIRSIQMEQVSGRAATRIGAAPGHEWLVVRGLVRLNRRQTPVCWSEHYINREFAAVGRLVPRNSGPIFLLIESLFGLRIAELDQHISSAAIPRTLAEELRASPGETSIEVRRTFRTADGKIAQITIHQHPAARFQQTIKMRRLAN
jgi:DNA-binding GntR family transcriptional regulator